MTLKRAIETYNRLSKAITNLGELERKLSENYTGPYENETVELVIAWDDLSTLKIAVNKWKQECNEILEKEVLSNFDKEEEHEQADNHRESD